MRAAGTQRARGISIVEQARQPARGRGDGRQIGGQRLVDFHPANEGIEADAELTGQGLRGSSR